MDIKSLVRKHILKMEAYSSARNKYVSGILMDANENPYQIFESDCAEKLNRYPDPNHNELRAVLAEYYGVKKQNLFVGNGSDEIIDLVFRLFCEPGEDNVIIPEPTYGMYKVSAILNNIELREVALDKKFQPDVETILKAGDSNSKILFLCSPNNPTGNLINTEIIKELADNFRGIILLDEAYIEFSDTDKNLDSLNEYNNIIRMRTLSKVWGLAGIRLGYCHASEEKVSLLYTIKPPYNVNRISQEIAINAIRNAAEKDKVVNFILSERNNLSLKLDSLSIVEKVFPSDSNFILFRSRFSKKLFDFLVGRGIIIRDRSSQLNLANCLRISVGTREENEILIKALEEFDGLVSDK